MEAIYLGRAVGPIVWALDCGVAFVFLGACAVLFVPAMSQAVTRCPTKHRALLVVAGVLPSSWLMGLCAMPVLAVLAVCGRWCVWWSLSGCNRGGWQGDHELAGALPGLDRRARRALVNRQRRSLARMQRAPRRARKAACIAVASEVLGHYVVRVGRLCPRRGLVPVGHELPRGRHGRHGIPVVRPRVGATCARWARPVLVA